MGSQQTLDTSTSSFIDLGISRGHKRPMVNQQTNVITQFPEAQVLIKTVYDQFPRFKDTPTPQNMIIGLIKVIFTMYQPILVKRTPIKGLIREFKLHFHSLHFV